MGASPGPPEFEVLINRPGKIEIAAHYVNIIKSVYYTAIVLHLKAKTCAFFRMNSASSPFQGKTVELISENVFCLQKHDD